MIRRFIDRKHRRDAGIAVLEHLLPVCARMAREDRSQLLAYCRIVIAGLHQRFGRVAQTETGEQRAPECRFDRADGDPSTIRATIRRVVVRAAIKKIAGTRRSEEHTSELQSLLRISYAVFCLQKKKKLNQYT